MYKISLAISLVIILSACQTLPPGLPNNFDTLKIKMQNGEEKKIVDTGWYKARKKIFDTGAYKFVLSATSKGGYYALNTPRYCPGINGLTGTLMISTKENSKINDALINKHASDINAKFNKWLEVYSPDLINACNVSKIFQSEIQVINGTYTHQIKSFNDEAIAIESMNAFLLMDNGKEKILTIISYDEGFPSLYTLKGEKLCSIDNGKGESVDLSTEGIFKLIEGPENNKIIPVSCIGGKNAVMDLRQIKLSSIWSFPTGSILLKFDEKTIYNLKLVQFMDDPNIFK